MAEGQRVEAAEVIMGAKEVACAHQSVLVALDDDFDRLQTFDGEVLRGWDAASLLQQLKSDAERFAIFVDPEQRLPNEGNELIPTICSAIEDAASRAGKRAHIVMRGDSFLPKTEHTVSKWPSVPPMQYQRLGDSGLKISKLILGCMTFGNPEWEGSPWVLPEKDALPLLKKAYDVGINTFETANTYSNGWSEKIVGRALREYSIPRSKVVIMTKLYYPVLEDEPNLRPQTALNDGKLVNQMGLSRKHIFEAVDASLRRLGTTYIDVLSIHRLDEDTRPEEVMRALHDLVQMGKVLYLGASSMYCWQFARLQYTAKMNGWTTFACMSGLHNLLYREEERGMIPFCNAEGIGLIPWSPIARGLLTRPWSEKTERSEQDVKTKKWFQGDQNEQIVERVARLAKKKGCSMSSLALAWLLHRGECPIVGLNSISRIEEASEALSVSLTTAEMRYLEEPYKPLQPQAI